VTKKTNGLAVWITFITLMLTQITAGIIVLTQMYERLGVVQILLEEMRVSKIDIAKQVVEIDKKLAIISFEVSRHITIDVPK
jgi:hypothetical protein